MRWSLPALLAIVVPIVTGLILGHTGVVGLLGGAIRYRLRYGRVHVQRRRRLG